MLGYKNLKPYQQASVKKLLTKPSALLNLDPGLGKTPIAVVACNNAVKHHQCTCVVVVCPASVKHTWERHFQDWAVPNLPGSNLNYTKLIFSYNQLLQKKTLEDLTKQLKALTKVKLNYILILDESHYCKTYSAKRTQTINALILAIPPKFIWFLTGTPLTKHAGDLYPQVTLLARGKLSYQDNQRWCEKYCYKWERRLGARTVTTYYGARNIESLQKILKHVLIQYKKADVLKDLPPKLISRIFVQLPSSVQLELASIDISATQRKELSLYKIQPTIDFIKDHFSVNDSPIIVYGYHREFLTTLQARLKLKYEAVELIDGSTPIAERNRIVTEFQDNKVQILLANILAAGTGLTLTKSNTMLIAETTWSPADVIQATDRIHRITQEKECNIYFLVAENTIDEAVVEVVSRKLNDISKTLNYDNTSFEQELLQELKNTKQHKQHHVAAN